MPQRDSTRRLDSSEVQGDGSYVVFRRLEVGLVKEIRSNPNGKTNLELNMDSILACVVDWNWVDDEGTPLPLPNEDPTVLDKLFFSETDFLIDAIWGTDEERKN